MFPKPYTKKINKNKLTVAEKDRVLTDSKIF